MVNVRLDNRATAISILSALGVRRDGQKVVLAFGNLGGESEAARRLVLNDLISRNLGRPELWIVDSAPGLEAAIARMWPGLPVQRRTVHKERNLLAHAPKTMREAIKADYRAMMQAGDTARVLARHRAFLDNLRRQEPRRGRGAAVPCCGFAPDGKSVLAGTASGELALFEIVVA